MENFYDLCSKVVEDQKKKEVLEGKTAEEIEDMKKEEAEQKRILDGAMDHIRI